MKVAVATQDMKGANAHFASARTLAVFEVSKEGHRLLEAVQFDQCSAEDGVHDEAEDRVGQRLAAIAGCAMLFVTGIGGPAAARVVNQRVHPVKLPKPEPISELMDRLQTSLRGTPPPWMRKILAADQKGSMDFATE